MVKNESGHIIDSLRFIMLETEKGTIMGEVTIADVANANAQDNLLYMKLEEAEKEISHYDASKLTSIVIALMWVADRGELETLDVIGPFDKRRFIDPKDSWIEEKQCTLPELYELFKKVLKEKNNGKV